MHDGKVREMLEQMEARIVALEAAVQKQQSEIEFIRSVSGPDILVGHATGGGTG